MDIIPNQAPNDFFKLAAAKRFRTKCGGRSCNRRVFIQNDNFRDVIKNYIPRLRPHPTRLTRRLCSRNRD
jgi:hypothetical protein